MEDFGQHKILVVGLAEYTETEDAKEFIQEILSNVFKGEPTDIYTVDDPDWNWDMIELVIYFPGRWRELAALEEARLLKKTVIFAPVEGEFDSE